MLALLDEAGLLMQLDTRATRRLADSSSRIIEVYSPESAATSAPLDFSDDELLDYFRGGGDFSDPRAEKALRSAVDVIRDNLRALEPDEVLIIEL
jgi:hypothetical protein